MVKTTNRQVSNVILGVDLVFKTKNPFYEKEEDGLKCNTVREVGDGDSRFDILMELIQENDYGGKTRIIRIVNPETKDSFSRRITDVTYFDERFIISWKHKTSQKRRKAK